MSISFADTIRSAFSSAFRFPLAQDKRLASPFEILHCPGTNLLIHCIRLDETILRSLDARFFQVKSAQAEAAGLRIVHLWEDIFTAQTEQVMARLQSLLGNNQTIHGRQCRVQRVDKTASAAFLSRFHLQFSAAARFHYGLFHREKLSAVATFSGGRIFDKNSPGRRSHELVRFASLPGITITGGFDKMIRAFADEIRPADIMTYADRDWSDGRGYEKLGFLRENETDPQAFYVHPGERIRYYPHRLPEKIMQRFEASGSADISAFLRAEGYFRIHNAGNIKFRRRF
ncbi:MAG: hypothetical protein INR69_05770 [Mucilaginibacter polytrichastri]|nr:hypothetical protein [Mucilaginibacter polytrichastri]